MPYNRDKILQWSQAGNIEAENLKQAIELAEAEPNDAEWLAFLKIGLLWSAVIALSAGVIFYFAYNWQNMGRFTKFALIEGTMLLATLAYIRIAKTKLLTSTTLMGMTLLTGALLALVGQTYQTGADPWQLFATWSLLILPWAFVARSSSLWTFWVLLANLSLSLYLETSHHFFGLFVKDQHMLWIFTLLNTLLLALFEIKYFRYSQIKDESTSDKQTNNNVISNWLNLDIGKRYVSQLLCVIAGFSTTVLAMWSIFDSRFDMLGFLFYVIWIAAGFYIYRYLLRDLFILSMGVLSVIVISISLLIEVLDNQLDEGGFLLISFAIIGLSTLAGIWLKGVSRNFAIDFVSRKENLS